MTALNPEQVWEARFYEQRPLIEAALARGGGTHTFADIDELRRAGRLQYWPGERSCIVTQIIDHPQKRVCHCWLAAGEIEELRYMAKWVEGWARSVGCSAATIGGRRGWERVLRGDGYRHSSTVLAKDLEGTR